MLGCTLDTSDDFLMDMVIAMRLCFTNGVYMMVHHHGSGVIGGVARLDGIL
jgi:hypothetical protein